MTLRLRPFARTRRFAIAAAINKAIFEERRPTLAAMTGPGPSRRQIDRTKIAGSTLLRWGDRFAGAQVLVEKDLSRGEAHLLQRPVAPWMFEASIALES